MSLIAFHDKSVRYDGSGWFTGNAGDTYIGAFGEKTGLGFVQKLEVKDHLPAARLAGLIRTSPGLRIDTNLSTQADFEASVKGSVKIVGFSGSLGQAWQALKQGTVVIVELHVEENALVDAVNRSPKAMDSLHAMGGDARIVSGTLMMTTAVMASSFAAGPSAQATIDVGGVVSFSTSGSAGVSGGTTVQYGPDSVFAYRLLKLEWNGKLNRFDGSHVDEPGLG